MKLTRKELMILEQLLETSINETRLSIEYYEDELDIVGYWENSLKEEKTLLLKVIKELEEGKIK